MAIKIKGITTNTEEKHYFWEYYAFLDSNDNFFIVTNECNTVKMCDDFPEEIINEEITIEDFLEKRFGTTLVKALEKDDFDIKITIK